MAKDGHIPGGKSLIHNPQFKMQLPLLQSHRQGVNFLTCVIEDA